MTVPPVPSTTNASDLLAVRLDAIQGTVGEIKERLDEVSRTLGVIAKLEAQHGQHTEALGRAFGEIKVLQDRITLVERDMPGLLEMRKWVVIGVLAGLGMVLAGLFKLVIVDPGKDQAALTQAVTSAVAEAMRQKP